VLTRKGNRPGLTKLDRTGKRKTSTTMRTIIQSKNAKWELIFHKMHNDLLVTSRRGWECYGELIMVFHIPCSVSRGMLSNENQAAFVTYDLSESETCCLDYLRDHYQGRSLVCFQPPVDH